MMRSDKSRRRFLLLSVAGVLCLLGQQADAEVQKFVVEEINPDRSTLDKRPVRRVGRPCQPRRHLRPRRHHVRSQ